MKGDQNSNTSLWRRFLGWLNDKKEPEPERLKFDLPNNKGDTDVLLSHAEKAKLQEAVDTAVYTRETSFYGRGGGSRSSRGSGKDVII